MRQGVGGSWHQGNSTHTHHLRWKLFFAFFFFKHILSGGNIDSKSETLQRPSVKPFRVNLEVV